MGSDAEWALLERLYHDALPLGPAERGELLGEACAGNELLRQKVEALLASGDSSDSFLEEPAFGAGMRLLAAEQQGDSLVGRRIGPFTILGVCGRGGMGTVYRAKDHEFERDVALKALPLSLAQDPERVQRFRQEARLAARINHKNVAQVYSSIEEEGRYFLVMEIVEGATLRQLLSEKKLGTRTAIDIAAQVAAGLAAAHASGVVHRDIKPENIMVRADGVVKVLDFGLAKLTQGYAPPEGQSPYTLPVAHDTAAVRTEFGILMGTAEYMSPEQALKGDVDERTDVWSLGVMLYEMICGRLPFEGPTSIGSIAEILKTEIPPHIPGMPVALEKVVRKALMKEPGERYQKIEEMQADLQEALDKERLDLPEGSAARPRRRLAVHVAVATSALVAVTLITLSALEVGKPVPTANPEPQSQGAPPGRVIDLSDTYGKVNMTIFNKRTRVVFASPHEFFQDSGVTSFDLPLKFEEFDRLPPGLRRWDGKELTPESRHAVDTQPCPPEACRR